jgi:hypothetical protein
MSTTFGRITVPVRSHQGNARNGHIDAGSHVLWIADSEPHLEDSRDASDSDAILP